MADASPLEHDLNRRCLSLMLLLWPLSASAELYVTVVEGLGGTPQYAARFSAEVATLAEAAASVTGAERVRAFTGEAATRDNVLAHFATLADVVTTDDRVAVILIGHGSYDGYDYKFNLPGPDLTGEDLASLFDELPAGIQLLVNTTSASGATLDRLSSDARIVITATRSGTERNATRFGAYFVAALTDPAADINKNDAISAQEAFDYAERGVTDYFEGEGRLATEHARLSGERAAQFTLARFQPEPPPSDDPDVARLIGQRDGIDERIEALQLRKPDMDSDDYFDQLQALFLELARVGDRIDRINQPNQTSEANDDAP